MQQTKIFLCVDVDTIYGYYQSRFGSLGPSYKGVPMPLKAQIFYTSQSGWVQLKFIFVAYEMSNTFLDHMQLDLGRYLLPFGRAHQMSKVSKSAQPLLLLSPSRLYKSGAQTKNGFGIMRGKFSQLQQHFSKI